MVEQMRPYFSVSKLFDWKIEESWLFYLVALVLYSHYLNPPLGVEKKNHSVEKWPDIAAMLFTSIV